MTAWDDDPEFGTTITHPDDRDRVTNEAISALRSRRPYTLEYRYIRADGETIWARNSGSFIEQGVDGAAVWQGLIVDITAEKQAELELQAAEARYRALVEQVPAVIYTKTQAGDITYMSPRIEQLTGNSPDEWVASDHWTTVVHHDDLERVRVEAERTDATGEPFRIEYRYITRSDDVIWVRNDAELIRDERGTPLFWQGLIVDITERKRAEETMAVLAAVVTSATDAILTTNTEMLITSWNAGAERLFGYGREEMLGQPVSTIVPGDRRQEFLDSRAHMNSGEPTLHLETIRQHKDGSLVDVAVTLSEIATATGEVVGTSAIYHDVTRRKQREAALSESEAWYRSLVRNFPNGAILLFDHDLRYLVADGAALETIGMPAAGFVGQTLHEAVSPEGASVLEPMYRAALNGDSRTFEMTARGHDFMVNTVPVHNDAGTVIAGMVMAVDITERKQAEIALRESENRFRGLVQHAENMVGILDATGTIRFESPATERWIGYRPDELVGRPCFEMLHPDEIDGITSLLGNVVSNPGVHLPLVYRCRHKDGSWRWLDATVTNLLDSPGIEGIVVNTRDITDRVLAEEAVRESEERFRSAFDDAAIGMVIQALEGEILRVNSALCALTGYDDVELVGQRGVLLSHPDDVDAALPHLDRIKRGEISTFMLEKRYRHKHGHTLWVLLNVAVVRDADGTPLHCITQAQNVSEQKELQATLLKQALHDQLTGLPSRVLLLDRTARALAQAERHGRNVAVLFLDLDNFKFINDNLGHAVGDDLLIQVASRVSGCLREGDTASRLGGDEFAILLPEVVGAQGAAEVAQRVLDCLSTPFVLAGRDITVTVSIGIALSSADTQSADELLRHADVAMYRAKAEGKRQYTVFDAVMHASILQRLEVEHDLRRAIVNEQFKVFYQPTVALDTAEIVGMEALIR